MFSSALIIFVSLHSFEINVRLCHRLRNHLQYKFVWSKLCFLDRWTEPNRTEPTRNDAMKYVNWTLLNNIHVVTHCPPAKPLPNHEATVPPPCMIAEKVSKMCIFFSLHVVLWSCDIWPQFAVTFSHEIQTWKAWQCQSWCSTETKITLYHKVCNLEIFFIGIGEHILSNRTIAIKHLVKLHFTGET